MKKLFFGSLLLLLFTACGPSTEQITTKYDNGKEREVFTVKKIKQGSREFTLKHGDYKSYHPNGKVEREAVYVDGRLWEVKAVYDTAGKVLANQPVKEGAGKLNVYHPDGMVAATFPYVNGAIEGRAQYFDVFGLEIVSQEFAANEPIDKTVKLGSSSTGFNPAATDSAGKTMNNTAPAGFNPAEADQLMKNLQDGKLAEAYKSSASMYKKTMSQTDFETYVNYLIKLYGPIKQFKRSGYQLENVEGAGEGVTVGYLTQFGFVKGQVIFNMLREGSQFKLVNMAAQVEDYAPIGELRRMSEPILKKIQSGEYEAVYKEASLAFRQNTPKDKYDALWAEFQKEGKVEKFEMVQHEIHFEQGRLICEIYYIMVINGKELPVRLRMVKYPQGFLLEGLSFA